MDDRIYKKIRIKMPDRIRDRIQELQGLMGISESAVINSILLKQVARFNGESEQFWEEYEKHSKTKETTKAESKVYLIPLCIYSEIEKLMALVNMQKIEKSRETQTSLEEPQIVILKLLRMGLIELNGSDQRKILGFAQSEAIEIYDYKKKENENNYDGHLKEMLKEVSRQTRIPYSSLEKVIIADFFMKNLGIFKVVVKKK